MFCWNFNSFNTTQILMCVLQSTSTQRTKNDKNKHISAVTTTKLSERTQIQTLHQLITKRFCWDSLQLSVFSSKHRMPLRWARDELMNCFFVFFYLRRFYSLFYLHRPLANIQTKCNSTTNFLVLIFHDAGSSYIHIVYVSFPSYPDWILSFFVVDARFVKRRVH